MVNLSGMFDKAKRKVRENPDAIRGGLDKVQRTINQRTGGKYADKLAKGRSNLDQRLGTPGRTKDAFTEGRAGHEPPPGPVGTDPITPPEPVGDPADLQRDPGTPTGTGGTGGVGGPAGTGGRGGVGGPAGTGGTGGVGDPTGGGAGGVAGTGGKGDPTGTGHLDDLNRPNGPGSAPR